MLEEDVATSSIAQDEIGHARALYELLATLTGDDADQIAFGREADAYRHAALLDHARGDWAFSVARRYLYETADAVRLGRPGAQLVGAARAAGRKDAARGDVPPHARRCLAAAPGRWAAGRAAIGSSTRSPGCGRDAQEVFAPLAAEEELLRHGFLPEPMRALHATWQAAVRPVLGLIVADLPVAAPSLDGRTRRTDDFRWLHGQFTLVARSEVGATW